MTVVAFIAERKSGKDYLCDHLVKTQGAVRLSFSDEVRYLTQKIFPWMPFDFPVEVKDEPFIHPKNPNNLTPREVWKLMGKVRDVEPGYFVDAFKARNANIPSDKLYIITDFRTPQEYDYIKANGILILKIIRADRSGIEPDSFEEYVREFRGFDEMFVNHMDGVGNFDVIFKRMLDGRK